VGNRDRSGNGSYTVARQNGYSDDRGNHSDRGGGLVFTGDLNGNLLALDATSGKMLYRYNTKNAMAGGIITYRAEATQYVAATAGNTSFVAWKVTGKPTLFVFAL
jgi:alcohol dehydrogenase (cytochrome c)